MAEVVITNKSTKRTDGKSATPEEMAEFLIKSDYPVPTKNVNELASIIAKALNTKLEDEQEEITLPESMFKRPQE